MAMGDKAGPVRDGTWAWTEALSMAEAPEARARLVGASASWTSLAFSSRDCLCRDLLQPECDMARGVGVLGHRVECLAGRSLRLRSAWNRVEACVRRGRPVPWFLGDREGVILDADGPRIHAKWVSLSGDIGEGQLAPQELSGARLYLVRPAPSLREPRVRREIHQVLEAVTRWLMPHAHGGHCPLCDGSDAGMASVSRVRAGLRSVADWLPRQGISRSRHHLWARRVADARTVAETMSGRSRTPYTTRMRYATEYLGDALGALARARGLFATSAEPRRMPAALGTFRSELDHAGECIYEACGWMLVAVCMRAQLPGHYAEMLYADPNEPIAEGHLSDLVYLARAGSVPFRRLAARRLAGSAENRGVGSTLRQLLHDSDEMTALMAADALVRSRDRAASGAFLDAYVRRERPASTRPFSLRAELLFDAALTDHVRTAAYLAEAGDGWRADFSTAGADLLEQVLQTRC